MIQVPPDSMTVEGGGVNTALTQDTNVSCPLLHVNVHCFDPPFWQGWKRKQKTDQWRRRKISCSFYLHLALLWCSSWPYVDLSFWHTLFSFYVKNSFEHFQQGRSAFHKFPHFFFVWEGLYFSWRLPFTFKGLHRVYKSDLVGFSLHKLFHSTLFLIAGLRGSCI